MINRIVIMISVFLILLSNCFSTNKKNTIEDGVEHLAQQIESVKYDRIEYRRNEQEVILYDEEGNEAARFLTDEELSKHIVRIYSEDQTLYFVLSAAVDDEYGFLYKDDFNIDMGGLWQVTRVSRNLYYYKTYYVSH